MWTVVGQIQPPKSFEPFEPLDILVWYDGPKTFTVGRESGTVFLAHWCCSSAELDRYLLVPIADAELDRLKAGTDPLRPALTDSPRHYVLDLKADQSVAAVWRVRIQDVPDDVLPHPDARLNFQPHVS
jgi:hypothetical protein